MYRLQLLAAAACLAAAPLAAQTGSTASPGMAPMAMPTAAADYVKMAGASDLYEKTSSQMVLKNAKDANIRRFAQQMVGDHNKTTKQVMAAAKAERIAAPKPVLMPHQQKMIDELRAASASEREQVYARQQVMAHEEALALHQTYSQKGDRPALQKVAGTAVPIVQQHLDQARGLAGGR